MFLETFETKKKKQNCISGFLKLKTESLKKH